MSVQERGDVDATWPHGLFNESFGPIKFKSFMFLGFGFGVGKSVMALHMAQHNGKQMGVLFLDTQPGRSILGTVRDWLGILRVDSGVVAECIPGATLDGLMQRIREDVGERRTRLVVINSIQGITHDGDETMEDELPTMGHISHSLK